MFDSNLGTCYGLRLLDIGNKNASEKDRHEKKTGVWDLRHLRQGHRKNERSRRRRREDRRARMTKARAAATDSIIFLFFVFFVFFFFFSTRTATSGLALRRAKPRCNNKLDPKGCGHSQACRPNPVGQGIHQVTEARAAQATLFRAQGPERRATTATKVISADTKRPPSHTAIDWT